MAFKLRNVGGYGTGAQGNKNILYSDTVNNVANITGIKNNVLTTTNVCTSTYGAFAAGNEVLFYVMNTTETGKANYGNYSIHHIVSVSGSTITLDSTPVVTDTVNCTCRLVSIPNFNNVTLTDKYNRYVEARNGILAMKIKGTLDIAGVGLYSTTYGALAPGKKVIGIAPTAADLASKLIQNEGSSIFFIVANNIKADDKTIIGSRPAATGQNGSSGLGKGGSTRCWNTDRITVEGEITSATSGGAGYGGGGGTGWWEASVGGGSNVESRAWGNTSGGTDAVGAVGGTCSYYDGRNTNYLTGGNAGYAGKQAYPDNYYRNGGYAGATVTLITNSISGYSLSMINTGGFRGSEHSDRSSSDYSGGGGGGFCYIACNSGVPAAPYELAYTLDTLSTQREGLLIDKTPVNCLTASSVTGFFITGVQPEKTDRRLLFSMDNKTWGKLAVASGVATYTALQEDVTNGDTTTKVNVGTASLTAEYVLTNGNTVAELASINSIPGFVGKSFYLAAALSAPDNATVSPSLKVAVVTGTNTTLYNHSEYSAEYSLNGGAGTPLIIDILPTVTTTGKATATVSVSLKNAGVWSEFMAPKDARNKNAEAVKYKADYGVTVLDGTDTAKIDNVVLKYTDGGAYVTGDTAELYTVTQDYEDGLKYCHAVLKHKQLKDATVKAYVSFRAEPKQRNTISIGTGTGKEQTIIVGINGKADTGINQNTLTLRANTTSVYDYSYNTETSEVTLTVDNGAAITASYEYGWEPETWQEMKLESTEPYKDEPGTYSSRYAYTLSDTVTDKKTISNVKFVLQRPTGTVTNESLGKATGNKQVILLNHQAKKETITCNGSWSYDDETRLLTVIAAKDTELVISYDWIAESQEVYGYVVGWAEA